MVSSPPSNIARPQGLIRRGEHILKRLGLNHSLLISLIIAIVIVTSLRSQFFLTVGNLSNVSRQIAVIGILSSGTTILMLAGLLDLSIGAVSAFVGLVVARLVFDAHLGFFPGSIVGVASAMLVGLATGWVVARTRAPSFMVTLASWTMFGGINLVLQGTFAIPLPPEHFTLLGQGEMFPHVAYAPLICIALWVVTGAAMRWNLVVHQLRVMGANEDAARLSGMNTSRLVIIAFVFNGFVVGLAGLVLLSRFGSAAADGGTGLEIAVIAAVVLGGAGLYGGRGSIFGSALGVLLIGLIANSLDLQHFSGAWQGILYGAIVAAAVIGREVKVNERWRRRTRTI